MSTLKEFIQNKVILPRLKQNGVLVVYDEEGQYGDICRELSSDTIAIVDTSESSITGREDAIRKLGELGRIGTKLEGMLVYVPTKAPITEEEMQIHPFYIYALFEDNSGQRSIFPDPTNSGDELKSLCMKHKPDHATEIRRIFSENPNPPFAVIDAIGAGTGWPNLQTLLEVESARDIIYALLAPSKSQKDVLEKEDSWISETEDLLSSCLGLNLVDGEKTYNAISSQLWRFVLFSEFVFDLPEKLPESLSSVPVAMDAAKPLINELCDRLRNDQRTMSLYIDKAETVEQELDLPKYCTNIEDLGIRDTFPFEERHFLKLAMKTLKQDKTNDVKSILKRHAQSVWVCKGESQTQWGLIQSAMDLCEACDDIDRQLTDHTRNLKTLIDFYLSNLREVDRLHREFELAVNDYITVFSYPREMIKQPRDRYRRLITKVHDIFIRNIAETGWPPGGHMSNMDVFDNMVAPKLQVSGCRVAYFLIDALRYELGIDLEKQLSEDNQVDIQAAYAPLPSITSVGMAALLPEAGKNLLLKPHKNTVVPVLNGVTLSNVTKRMEVFSKRFGERFSEMKLHDFIRTKKELSSTVELLVLRNVEIDTQLETSPETTLGIVHDTLKRIRVAVHKLKTLGFNEVVIATDHGFFLNTQLEAGDVCAKPSGNWINAHERLLLGDGSEDPANFTLPAEKVGIRGDFAKVAGPKGLVSYRSGELYFHGGISLQECIVPVLTIKLGKDKPDTREPAVRLTYKDGAKRITTRLPVVNVSWVDMQISFDNQSDEIEVLLEAQTSRGKIVGIAKSGGPVNPSTGTITIKSEHPVQVTLKMQLEFEGKFSVKVMNPTTLATYCKLDLETDYMV